MWSLMLAVIGLQAGAAVRRALRRLGMSDKEAGLTIGMNAPQVCRQLSGEEHLHLDRWIQIPGLAWWIGYELAQMADEPVDLERLHRFRMAQMDLACPVSAKETA